MEATDPRITGAGWAPPPPVAEAPPRMGGHRTDEELDFEATLGSLVEKFKTLPPPSFGEPPAESEVIAPQVSSPPHPLAPSADKAKRWPVMVAIAASMVVGASVTFAVMLGPRQLLQRLSGPTNTAAAPVAVTWEKPPPASPKAEPLTAPAPAPKPAAKAVVDDQPAAAKDTAADKAPPKVAETKAERLVGRKPVAGKKSSARKGSRQVTSKRKTLKKRKNVARVAPRKGRAPEKARVSRKVSRKESGDWTDPYK